MLAVSLCQPNGCGDNTGASAWTPLPFDPLDGEMRHLKVHIDADTVTAVLDDTPATVDRRDAGSYLPPLAGDVRLTVGGSTFSGADPLMTVDNLNIISLPWLP
jgi:hypothetical protein